MTELKTDRELVEQLRQRLQRADDVLGDTAPRTDDVVCDLADALLALEKALRPTTDPAVQAAARALLGVDETQSGDGETVTLTRAELMSGILVGIGGEHDPVPTQAQLDRAADLIFRYGRRNYTSSTEWAAFSGADDPNDCQEHTLGPAVLIRCDDGRDEAESTADFNDGGITFRTVFHSRWQVVDTEGGEPS